MITLNEICGYLPYKLKVIHYEKIKVMNMGQGTSNHWVGIKSVLFGDAKPLLYPLSYLANEYELENYGEGKFMELANIYFFDQLRGNYQYATNMEGLRDSINNPMHLPYNLLKKLYEWHFDIHGLIERGDAIDINTLTNMEEIK